MPDIRQPYGSWSSPVAAATVAAAGSSPGEVRADGDDIWWSESRPSEKGRTQLVHRSPDGTRTDVLPDGYSARTRVHEYGGGAWCVGDGLLVFANADDQRLYSLRRGEDPIPLSPEPVERCGLRYADLSLSPDGRYVVAVREAHGACRPAGSRGSEPVNEVVAIALDGSAAHEVGEVVVLASGADFYMAPRVAPSGARICWIEWDHPEMPWDSTRLMVARLRSDGVTLSADGDDPECLAGGPGESVVAPQWLPGDEIVYSSDRTGWWNPYIARSPGDERCLAAVAAEIGGPPWVFGLTYLAWIDRHRFVCTIRADGVDTLALGTADGLPPVPLETGFTHVSQVVPASGGSVLVVAGGPRTASTVARVSIASNASRATVGLLRPEPALDLGGDALDDWVSVPEHIEVPTTDGERAFALVYRPTSPTSSAPSGSLPPLIVMGHGGPTSAARAQLNLSVQFWTSRGFCVADVNYRGSVGYGRAFRDALRGRWGVADVDDCVAVARHLASAGEVDPQRLAIRGGSAGGFTALAAVTFHDTFTAAASHYGIADLETLARDTHKFEARYLDGLVGPWPAEAETYKARSPIHHTDSLSCPLAIFQGLEDEVVPPSQAEAMVAALTAKGLPYAYLKFEGEQHGFRMAQNIVRALEGELWFYSRVFGFEPADEIEPVPGVGL